MNPIRPVHPETAEAWSSPHWGAPVSSPHLLSRGNTRSRWPSCPFSPQIRFPLTPPHPPCPLCCVSVCLRVHGCAHMHLRVCVCARVSVYLCVCVHTCMSIIAHTSVRACACVCVCLYECTVSVPVCTCVYMCTCMHVCVFVGFLNIYLIYKKEKLYYYL